MATAMKLLHPLKRSLTAVTSSSARLSSYGSSKPFIRRWVAGNETLHRFSGYRCKFTVPRVCICSSILSGSRIAVRNIFGMSVIFGSISLWPHVAYAMDGHDVLLDDHCVDLMDSSDTEEDRLAFWRFARRFWLPVSFFLIVLASWDCPIVLMTKLVLFLLGTKPSPLSVYVYVEPLCRYFMRKEPHLYTRKSLYASKVEVKDYKLLCLASVEVSKRKILLVGILGGWWPCPEFFMPWNNSSSSNAIFRELLRTEIS